MPFVALAFLILLPAALAPALGATPQESELAYGSLKDVAGVGTPPDIRTSRLECERGWADFCRTWGGPRFDIGHGIVHHGGALYVAGETWVASDNIDTVVLKYDPNGTLLWQRVWGVAGEDRLYGISAWNGSIYAAGWTLNATGGRSDLLLLSYAPDGSLNWKATWGHGDEDNSRAVVARADGIYVAGETTGQVSDDLDGFLARFTHDGSFTGSTLMEGAGDQRPWSMTSRSDEILVSGSSMQLTEDLFVWSFRPDLSLRSTIIYSGSRIDAGWSISARGDQLFVGGFTDSSGNGNADALLLYEGPGIAWNMTWGGHHWDSAYSVAIADGFLYVLAATHSYGNGNGDPALLKMELDGSIVWFRPWGGQSEDSGLGIALVGNSIYITGYTYSYGNGSQDIHFERFTDTTGGRVLGHAEVRPEVARLAVGESLAFRARAVDSFDEPLRDASLDWSVAGAVGTVDSDGVFTATAAGVGELRAQASFRGAFANATARVEVFDPADETPPSVLWTLPANGSTGADVRTPIVVAFSEPMDRPSVESNLSIHPAMLGEVRWAGDEIRFIPSLPLDDSTRYEVRIDIGANDLAGNSLATELTFSFRTADPVWLPEREQAFQVVAGAVLACAILAGVALAASARRERRKR